MGFSARKADDKIFVCKFSKIVKSKLYYIKNSKTRGKLPVPGRPIIWMIVGQGPIALAVVPVGVVWTYLLSSVFSLPILPLSGRRPDID